MEENAKIKILARRNCMFELLRENQAFVVVQLLSHVQLFATRGLQHTRLPCPSLFPRVCSIKLMSVESVMLSNHLILWCPLLLLPSVFPSIRAFSNESMLCIWWLEYWSFSISPSNEHSRLLIVFLFWVFVWYTVCIGIINVIVYSNNNNDHLLLIICLWSELRRKLHTFN